MDEHLKKEIDVLPCLKDNMPRKDVCTKQYGRLVSCELEVPPYARFVLTTLEEAGFETWIVGGFVRDALLGRPSHDVDIATSAPWQEVCQLFRTKGCVVLETGTNLGSVTVLVSQPLGEIHPVEVTTFRCETTYSDARHPDAIVKASSIEEDIERRDFTVNALAYHPKRGLLDVVGGLQDLKNRRLRAVGDASTRLTEDALRSLRALRFSAQLEFSMEPSLENALHTAAPLLSKVSWERRGRELEKLLQSPHAPQVIREHKDVFFSVFPQLASIENFDQRTPYHAYDVAEHTLRVLAATWIFAGTTPCDALLFAALLHDIGKPEVAFVDVEGVGHFKRHAQVSAQRANAFLKRLGIKKAVRLEAVRLIRLHDREIWPQKASLYGALAALQGEKVASPSVELSKLLVLQRADALAKAPRYIYRACAIEQAQMLLYQMLYKKDVYSMHDLAVSGKKLIDAHIATGPLVGEALQFLLFAVEEGVKNSQDALYNVATNYVGLKRLLTPSTPAKRSIGVELERFVYDGNHQVFYSSHPGLQDLLDLWAVQDGAARAVYEDDKILGLTTELTIDAKPVGASLSLEPGSQFEMSVGPAQEAYILLETFQQLDERFARLSQELTSAHPWKLVAAATHPTEQNPHKIPLLFKKRYQYMDAFFQTTGTLGADMMRRSASTQFSVDVGPLGFRRTYQLAVAIGPLLAYLSSLFQSKTASPSRLEIWQHTDPARDGVVPATFDDDFSLDTYIYWLAAQKAMLFCDEQGQFYPSNKRIVELLSQRKLSDEELKLALSLVFPNVRLKGFLELRDADSVEPRRACELAAFVYAIFYDEEAAQKAWQMLCYHTRDKDVVRAATNLAKDGMNAVIYGQHARDIFHALFNLANNDALSARDRDLLRSLTAAVKNRVHSTHARG